MIYKKKKTLLIWLFGILLLFLAGVVTLVWLLNTLSQDKVLTTAIIKGEISHLLDLDSDVQNPHAYLDWDLKYKIRADKLVFKNHDQSDLISLDHVKVDVFVPYFFIRKIYITQLKGQNLYVDFVRYPDNKINIIEIFNVTGFFKVYFHNSSVNVDKYTFSYKDMHHKPAESMKITGESIALTKFTLNKYVQLMMDGNINYNNKNTPFLVHFNTKFPVKNKNFNLEVELPDIDTNTFKTYIQEFAPKIEQLNAKGRLKAKWSSDKYVNLVLNLKNIHVSVKNLPNKLDFDNDLMISAKLGYGKNNVIIDAVNFVSDNFAFGVNGKITDIDKKKPIADLNIKFKDKASVKEMAKLIPSKIRALKGAVDKFKRYGIDGKICGSVHIKGNLLNKNSINAWGKLDIKDVNLGYNEHLHKSYAKLEFLGNNFNLDSILYPNSSDEFIRTSGNIKFTAPYVLDLKVKSSLHTDLVSTQKGLNIISDTLNFTTGPVPTMIIEKGRGEIDLSIKGTPPNVYLKGFMRFYDGIAGYPGFYGVLNNVKGYIDFSGDTIYYKDISGAQDTIMVYASGKTEVHKNGLTKFTVSIPSVRFEQGKQFVHQSQKLEKLSNAMRFIKNQTGNSSIQLDLLADKTHKIPHFNGVIKIQDAGCNLVGFSERFNNINGIVKFRDTNVNMDLSGVCRDINVNLRGDVRNDFSNLNIDIPNADIEVLADVILKSERLSESNGIFDKFKDYSGTVNTNVKLFGNFSNNKLGYYATIDVLGAKFKYLDISDEITVTGGKIIAQQNNLMMQNVTGTLMNTDFKLNGDVSDIAGDNENNNLKLSLKNINVEEFKKILKSEIIPDELKEMLKDYDILTGGMDIAIKVKNNIPHIFLKFYDLKVLYKVTKEEIIINSGSLYATDKIVKLNDIVSELAGSHILVDGSIKNYISKPLFNLEFTTNLSDRGFNEILAPMLKIKSNLIGNLYANIKFVGDIDDWNLKTRAMLDADSNVFFRGVNMGEGISKFMFLDLSKSDDDITINTLDIFSPNSDPNASEPDILAQVYGKINNVSNSNPVFENVQVKLNDYMTISILNMLFDSEKPVLKDGKIKGYVSVNGPMDKVEILGKAEVSNAVISTINAKIEEMIINFENQYIKIPKAILGVSGSKAVVRGVLENKLNTPVTVKSMDFNSEYINFDTILRDLNRIMMSNNDMPIKPTKETKVVKADTSIPPVVIENCKINVDEVIYSGISMKNMSANFSITPEWNFIIDNLSVESNSNGKLTGNLIYGVYNHNFEGNIAFENIMANAFATSFLNLPNEIYGDLYGEFSIKSHGDNRNEMISNMNGNAEFTLKNGRMLRLGSVEYMLKMSNMLQSGITRLNLNALVNIIAPKTGYFDVIEGKLVIKKGILVTDKITSKSKELNLFLNGAYNMNNAEVNALIIGQLPKESKQAGIWLGSLGKISVNSLVKKLTRASEKDHTDVFLSNPLAYINSIDDLKEKKDYRFFLVRLEGNLYMDKYVKEFKWIK